jgi:hypothetical protein
MNGQKFINNDNSFIVDADYVSAFKKLGLNSIDDIFSFAAGEDLVKINLASFRSRIKFQTDSPANVLYLKRYNKPPVSLEFKNWLVQKGRKSFGKIDYETSINLLNLGINTAKVVAFGEQKGLLFEKRSFCIIEQIPNADSIERKLPPFFNRIDAESRTLRKKFIVDLAEFINNFHKTGYRHRDLYFSHIFYDDKGRFYLIDLSRVFKPQLSAEYYRIKDIAELYYSAPIKYFSNTDRLRFYFAYSGCDYLSDIDKRFIQKVIRKVRRIEHHDKKRRSVKAKQ